MQECSPFSISLVFSLWKLSDNILKAASDTLTTESHSCVGWISAVLWCGYTFSGCQRSQRRKRRAWRPWIARRFGKYAEHFSRVFISDFRLWHLSWSSFSVKQKALDIQWCASLKRVHNFGSSPSLACCIQAAPDVYMVHGIGPQAASIYLGFSADQVVALWNGNIWGTGCTMLQRNMQMQLPLLRWLKFGLLEPNPQSNRGINLC